jgi:hypothetical protein
MKKSRIQTAMAGAVKHTLRARQRLRGIFYSKELIKETLEIILWVERPCSLSELVIYLPKQKRRSLRALLHYMACYGYICRTSQASELYELTNFGRLQLVT